VDRGTTGWLIALAFAALCWLVSREVAIARARAARRSILYKDKVATVTLFHDGSPVQSVRVNLLGPKRVLFRLFG
jgi:hypothetical protein